MLMLAMAVLAVVVFIALFRFKAGYGFLRGGGWGPQIGNRAAWVLMELPAFATVLFLLIKYLAGPQPAGVPAAPLVVMASLFLLHYFQRTFIFPLLLRGHSRMPVAIMAMGMIFNFINGFLIGGWLFVYAPANGVYDSGWLLDPRFITGTLIFFAGMFINMQSDHIIRHLRKPGDTAHYIPTKGMFRYVTSANYFGEITEWVGYAILTWSPAGALFAIWTIANLAPRSKSLTEKYIEEFGDEYTKLNKKNLIPYVW